MAPARTFAADVTRYGRRLAGVEQAEVRLSNIRHQLVEPHGDFTRLAEGPDGDGPGPVKPAVIARLAETRDFAGPALAAVERALACLRGDVDRAWYEGMPRVFEDAAVPTDTIVATGNAQPYVVTVDGVAEASTEVTVEIETDGEDRGDEGPPYITVSVSGAVSIKDIAIELRPLGGRS